MKPRQDERLISEHKALNAKVFGWTYMGLWLLILRRQWWLDQPIEAYLDLFLLTMAASAGLLFGLIRRGLYLAERGERQKRRNLLLSGLIATATFTAVRWWLGDEPLGITTGVGALTFFGIWIGLQFFFVHLSNRQAQKEISED